ncbi:MAG: hypothetical protein K2P54_06410, partial [Odoribacter sp.]|nr:hypothetical protein [Odoribacter sp.]
MMKVFFLRKNLGFKSFIFISIVLLVVSIVNACSKDKETELSTPTNLSAVQVGKEIVVTWDDVTDAISYCVVYSSNSQAGSEEVYNTRWSFIPILTGSNDMKIRFKVASMDGNRMSVFS